MAVLRMAAVLALASITVACSSGSHAAPPATTSPPTAPPTTPTTAAPVSNLTVTGVSPGVEQAPFYPATKVSSVDCGPVPGGVFVAAIIPAGAPGTPAGSAVATPTLLVVVKGEAVIRDGAGKDLYRDTMSSIQTSRSGAFVLSLESVTYIGGNGRTVPQGAMNIDGDYTCPATNIRYPGL